MNKIILVSACSVLLINCGHSLTTNTTTDAAVPINGSNGHNALVLVSTEAAGSNCVYGGQKIETGLDTNDDATLESSEVTRISYVCNGSNGPAVHNPLVFTTIEPTGNGVCNNLGGIKIETTIDFDDDANVDPSTLNMQELAGLNTSYICNGTTHSVLIEVVTEYQGQNCPFGGNKIIYGQDLNDDTTLQPSEVTATSYVCAVLS